MPGHQVPLTSYRVPLKSQGEYCMLLQIRQVNLVSHSRIEIRVAKDLGNLRRPLFFSKGE